MYKINAKKLAEAIFFGILSFMAVGVSHSNVVNSSMADMEGMRHHDTSSIQCQVRCTTAIVYEDTSLLDTIRQDKDPAAATQFVVTVVLSLLAVSFVVKYLHLQTSWRPPDKVLLCGRYADGL